MILIIILSFFYLILGRVIIVLLDSKYFYYTLDLEAIQSIIVTLFWPITLLAIFIDWIGNKIADLFKKY